MLEQLNPKALIQMSIVGGLISVGLILEPKMQPRAGGVAKIISPWLALYRLITLRRIASSVAVVQSLTAGKRRHQVRRNDEVDVMS